MVETLSGVVVLALFVEGITEYLKDASSSMTGGGPKPWLKYVSLILGMIVCFLFDADVFGALGIESAWPHAGAILTGLIVGRGSNHVNDLISKIKALGNG